MEPLAAENEKTQGGQKPLGEEYPASPTRTRPCRVQRAGPGIPKGGPYRKAGGCVRASAELVRATGRYL